MLVTARRGDQSRPYPNFKQEGNTAPAEGSDILDMNEGDSSAGLNTAAGHVHHGAENASDHLQRDDDAPPVVEPVASIDKRNASTHSQSRGAEDGPRNPKSISDLPADAGDRSSGGGLEVDDPYAHHFRHAGVIEVSSRSAYQLRGRRDTAAHREELSGVPAEVPAEADVRPTQAGNDEARHGQQLAGLQEGHSGTDAAGSPGEEVEVSFMDRLLEMMDNWASPRLCRCFGGPGECTEGPAQIFGH